MDLRLLWNNLSPHMTRISAAPFPFLYYMADQMLGVYLSVQSSIKGHLKKNPKLKKKFVVLKNIYIYLIRQERVASLWLCGWVLCYLDNFSKTWSLEAALSWKQCSQILKKPPKPKRHSYLLLVRTLEQLCPQWLTGNFVLNNIKHIWDWIQVSCVPVLPCNFSIICQLLMTWFGGLQTVHLSIP